MHNYYPILWVGAIIGVISTLLIVAAFVVKDGEKETGFERNMKDSEIMQRLMDYAKPFIPPVYRCWFSDAVFDRVRYHFAADRRQN